MLQLARLLGRTNQVLRFPPLTALPEQRTRTAAPTHSVYALIRPGILAKQPSPRGLTRIEQRPKHKQLVVTQFFAAPNLPDARRSEVLEQCSVHRSNLRFTTDVVEWTSNIVNRKS